MQDWLVKDRQGWQREMSPGVSAGEDNLATSVAGVEQKVVLMEIYCRRWAEWQNYDKSSTSSNPTETEKLTFKFKTGDKCLL